MSWNLASSMRHCLVAQKRDPRTTPSWPEEEPQWPHVTQVHPKDAAQLLQSQHLLLLLPPRAMWLAAALGRGVAVQAGGRARRVGHGLLTQLPGIEKKQKTHKGFPMNFNLIWVFIVLKLTESCFFSMKFHRNGTLSFSCASCSDTEPVFSVEH